MSGLNSAKITCPYCWQQIEIAVDPSLNRQEYVEDCQVCCRPILFRVHIDVDNHVHVDAVQEN